MVNAIYCGLCFSQSADEAHHGPQVSRGKAGRGRRLTGLRVTEVNILQVRVSHTFERIEVLSRKIFCN